MVSKIDVAEARVLEMVSVLRKCWNDPNGGAMLTPAIRACIAALDERDAVADEEAGGGSDGPH